MSGIQSPKEYTEYGNTSWKECVQNLNIHVVVFKVGIIHENICAEWVKAESRGRRVSVEESSCEQFSTGTTVTQILILESSKKEPPNSLPVRWVALPDHLHAWWISVQSHSLLPILRPSFCCKTFSLNLSMEVKPTKTKTKLHVLQPLSKLHNAGPGNQDDQRRDHHSPSLQKGLLVP